jgi:hypothetical protein
LAIRGNREWRDVRIASVADEAALTGDDAAWCPRHVKLASFALVAATLAACAETSDSTLAKLKTRASFDLQCPKSQLKTIELDDRTRGVTGCGQQATYVEQCESNSLGGMSIEGECTWVLNTDARRRRSSDGD